MISKSWEKVPQKTIANCFTYAGFKDLITITSVDMIYDNEKDNIPLAQSAQNLGPLSITEAEVFINVDKSITNCAPATEDEEVEDLYEKFKRKMTNRKTLRNNLQGRLLLMVSGPLRTRRATLCLPFARPPAQRRAAP
ncbi:hypothetical protein EVAR_59536_1 [Eumeta japonica]|uniref:DDE-1 domain-containing protein n=1 Tax=Eumeta variegata TaxID=151549 RepID=A0A4C1XX43_EUMVA|nr:hypothetical protein EVAR_59536_1 [Eumeta japonica]